MRATQALVLADAAHEDLDRLHHERIGRGRIQGRARGCELRRIEFPVFARPFQCGNEFAAKDLGERLERKEKPALGCYLLAIHPERPAGHQGMHIKAGP